MKISKDKKIQILADKEHLSINQISKKYNLPRSEIKKIIDSAEKKTPKWFYAVLVLIPIVILFLLELGLRVFNYGYDTGQWVDAGNGKYIINPEIGKRYFTNVDFTPGTTEDVFDQQKKPGAFRVFVLGGSSAAGYPFMPMGSFSRYIRRRLELVYPNTPVEVVNISMTGVNSYTLLDIFPGVLEQKPDLILIYAGHNEYYGALGIGSVESFGSSRAIVNLILYLNNFKLTQLVRNSIHWVTSLFITRNNKNQSSTLMSKMAGDQSIRLNSEKFNDGIEQFSGNLRDILILAEKKGVPVILGRVVSNLKDQKPFISVSTPRYGTANQVYSEAQTELSKNSGKADSLFRLAKDLDALRFRAPEKINTVINKLAGEFNAGLVYTDSIFDSDSPSGIVGDNLIVDHLHLNIKGNQLMGKIFYEAMVKLNDLPKNEKPALPFKLQDSITVANFMFTHLDSVIGNYIITLLKNDWPFVEKRNQRLSESLFNRKNFIDSIAVEFIEKKITWADAHLSAATDYLRKDDIKDYLKHMNVLIYQYPDLKNINTALKYFYGQNRVNPLDYTNKRIGLINLYNNKFDDAINYLSQSYKTNPEDPSVLYSLSLAYSKKKNFTEALNTITKCLNIRPDYPEATKLKKKILIELKNN